MRIPVVERPLGGFNDVRRGWKVGLADLQVDDVATLGLELARLGEHLEGGLGADLAHAVRQFHAAILSRRTGPGRPCRPSS